MTRQEATTAIWMVRLGSRASSAHGAEASKTTKDRVDGARRDAGEAVVALDRREVQGEDVEGVAAAGFGDQPDGQGDEHEDLEQAEQRAGPGADLDAAVVQGGDQDRADDHEDDPGGGERPAPLAVGDRAEQVPEQHHGDRSEQRLDQRVPPADEEAERGVDGFGGIGVDAAGARQVLGQLADRGRDQQARDQGEQHGQRQRAAGIGSTSRDRQRDRARRRHGSNRLEQNFPQADGPSGQARTAGGQRVLLCPLPSVIDRAPGIYKGLAWLKMRKGADRNVALPKGPRRARG
jgi:hypothetical protein